MGKLIGNIRFVSPVLAGTEMYSMNVITLN